MAAKEFPVQTRFVDADAFGHVNNAVYLSYCELAREALYLEDASSGLQGDAHALVAPGTTMAELWGSELFVLVSSHRVEYRSPLTPRRNPLGVRTWVTRIGRSSFDFGYELTDPDHRVVYALVNSGMVVVSRETGRPVPLTDAQLAVLESWSGPPVAFRPSV